MEPTILLVRHGNTTYDTKVDAILDPPLDFDGVERIKRTVRFILDTNLPFHRILTSPKQRAKMAAEMLAKHHGKVTVNVAARPWDLGRYMGREEEEVHDKIKMLEELPDIKAPEGESYREFYKRWSDLVIRMQQYVIRDPDQVLILFTHSRNINLIPTIIEWKDLGPTPAVTPEGSVTKLYIPHGSGSWETEIIWEGN
jgi:broad specificity phosphatase PhoE